MSRTPLRSVMFMLIGLVPALLPAQRLWVGMPVTSIPMESQLSAGLPPDFVWDGLYLVEFNGTRFADPSSESGAINLELFLRQWDAFRASPPLTATRLTFLQFEGELVILHRVELAAWDGKMAIDGAAEPFQLRADPEVRHYNTYIYLKTARLALASGDAELAKAYLIRLFILDPACSEAPEARELLDQIGIEERGRGRYGTMAE